MRSQLSTVLDFFQTLQQVDTSGIEPTGSPTDVSSVMRDDDPTSSLSRSETLANAPHTEDDYVRVLPVLGTYRTAPP